MPLRDVGSWNAMIYGFCQNGNAAEALDALNKMKMEGLKMDTITVSSILPVCAQSGDMITGMLIHLIITQLLHLDTLKEMQLIGTQSDLLTVVSLASIFGQLSDRKNSRSIHGFVMRHEWLDKDVVIGNALVNMYAKLDDMDCARIVSEQLPLKDIVSWNTLITGYAHNGLACEAIDAYSMMTGCSNISPNQGTWVSILPAYSHVGALQQGMKIHGRVIKNCLNLDVYVNTRLIDIYGKCWRLDDAMSLFYEVSLETSVPWNAIISCHGIHGQGEDALKLFKDMLPEGVKPDHVTFVSLLSACSHSGLVDEGQRCFDMMQREYKIKPSLKHYSCMVDLLVRAGYLDKAYNLVTNMPVQPNASVWGALLGACRIYGNVELGKFASDRLFEVDSENVGYYVLLSNMSANVGKWEVVKIRSLARDRGLKKTPGWSSIVVDSKVEVFYTWNQTHPKCMEIYKELSILTARTKSIGYVPDYSFVLQDVEDDEKDQILMSHSERLAMAFGIISTPPRSLIRLFKNLHVCSDCHNATKYISKITEREIVVRDSNLFHHFKDGVCSCDDYW
ncbi:hypothetical protein L6164_007034 [Bauhinia variegata]|uniref:Uncharacterized protein n=1 Tax=Bauhinia variegata TaxID=167791 RepID=A0ACB9PYD7_BAUVA|nr:hypothetical protein L6164_007034 [Bauhinia variegata]